MCEITTYKAFMRALRTASRRVQFELMPSALVLKRYNAQKKKQQKRRARLIAARRQNGAIMLPFEVVWRALNADAKVLPPLSLIPKLLGLPKEKRVELRKAIGEHQDHDEHLRQRLLKAARITD